MNELEKIYDNDFVLFEKKDWYKGWFYVLDMMSKDNPVVTKYGWKNDDLNCGVYSITNGYNVIVDLNTCIQAPTAFTDYKMADVFSIYIFGYFSLLAQTKKGKRFIRETKRLYRSHPINEWGECEDGK